MLTEIAIASVDDLIKVYPELSQSESLELGTRYRKRVSKVLEEADGRAGFEGESAISQDAVERGVADLMARRLEEYREATSSAITRFQQEGSTEDILNALNTIIGRLTGFREFIRSHLPSSVTEIDRVRMDTRIEVQMEDSIRRISKAVWMADAGMMEFGWEKGWRLLTPSR